MGNMITLQDVEYAAKGPQGSLIRKAIYDSAFRLVSDPKDWRAPIDKSFDFEGEFSRDVIKAAVEYFTGAPCEVIPNWAYGYRVKSVGYREGPCGP